ncbi:MULTISPECIES: N-acetylmuramoyl-L-alanine amidase family protein [Thermoanaerobacter]|uniref:Cell wall hydrolase/autolysin n=2 Tax=Thermoanaerobacter TaxID=1754 RepID=B0KC17_THEP3|nr:MULTISPECIES: N-acetylmuramoyl-L-alanine amidase [Thermoanaerobacter]ABY92080.1 cell wall hydrolase/autolysin [Thermoanaerobacter sp. X514]ABY93953.1 cell wall hydrolase/autolysin [Thermoanaerobacter pseudethanolicus ATCC 33223]ADV78911.1 cell wall hydrolase/autolysin [Thermoanaerobacter brockii subsp. finnii Ako-1]HAA80467.1 N-acetylmuramoyl-L-alanine amidase [Thermoanaerobacter sp.]HBW60142.1 N-acetylmuramoyl-L-alanine amidase [Thermoanaerobacter sp.]
MIMIEEFTKFILMVVSEVLIAIDPGHGGKDPGAVVENYKEKDLNLDIALKLREILLDKNISVIMTRDKDETVDLQQRCDIANKNKVDYFISIHCNSFKDPTANGTETYAYPGSIVGQNLAQYVQNEIVEMLKTANRGVKYATFYVLKHTVMPAILVETAFMSNPQNLDLLLHRPDIFAQAISNGIIKFLESINYQQTDDIKKLRRKGIINEHYDPKSFVTWGEFASVIIKILGGTK